MSDDRPHCYEFGPFRVDPAQRVLLRDGRIVSVQRKAFEILLLLVRNPGRSIGKEELLTRIVQLFGRRHLMCYEAAG